MDDAKKERLAELLRLKQERELQEEAAAEERQLAAEELAASLEGPPESGKFGTRGEDFEVICHRYGVWAVRKPDGQAIATWDRVDEKKRWSVDWAPQFLRNYILPSKEEGLKWQTVCGQRPGLI